MTKMEVIKITQKEGQWDKEYFPEDIIKLREAQKPNNVSGCKKEVTRGAYTFECGEVSRAGNMQLCMGCKNGR